MRLILKDYKIFTNDVVNKNLWQLSLSEIISRALNFITVIFIARHYGVDNFGLLGFVAAIVYYFMYVINFGYDTYGTGEVAKLSTQDANHIFNDVLSVKLFSLIPSLICLSLLGFILLKDTNNLLFFLIYATTLIPFSLDSQWFFLGIQKTEFIPIIRLIESLIYLVLVITVYYYFSETFIWVPVAILFAKMLAISYAFVSLKKIIVIRPHFIWTKIKKIISNSFLIGLSSVFALLYLNFDVIMLGYMKNNYDVGIYNSAIKIYLILVIPFQLIFSSFYPSLTKGYYEESDNLRNIFIRYLKYQLVLGIVLMLFSFILCPLVIKIFLGKQYLSSIIPLRILSINILIVSISFAFGNSLIAWRKQKYHTISLAAGAVVNIVLNFILIPHYSYFGAAYATVASEVIVCVLLLYFFYQNFGKEIKW